MAIHKVTARCAGFMVCNVEAGTLREAILASQRDEAEWHIVDEVEAGELISVEGPNGELYEAGAIVRAMRESN